MSVFEGRAHTYYASVYVPTHVSVCLSVGFSVCVMSASVNSGGLELLFGNQKQLDISVPAPASGAPLSIRHVLNQLKVLDPHHFSLCFFQLTFPKIETKSALVLATGQLCTRSR